MLFLELSAGQRVLRYLGAVLCDVIYSLISHVYELFMTVARLNLLNSDQIAPIYQRVTMMLTIIMTFYITFEFVKYTIEPDSFTDREKGAGNIMKRVIIVVVLIAFMPNIFSFATQIQSRIIETNLISKMVLGTTTHDYTSYGNEFSANMLNLFYYYDEDVCSGGGGDCADAKTAVEENLEQIRETGDVSITAGINAESTRVIFKEKYPAIKFNAILAPIVGGIMLYILALYCIDVGVRYAQLIFLQIISPIAIMGYLLPKKDGVFQKWVKQCITTYLDLFLRLLIINFVLLIIKTLGDGFTTDSIFAGMEISKSLKVLTYIVLVLGLLIFAQRAPKLLGDLLPGGGAAGIGFGIGAKDRTEALKKSFGALKSPFAAGGKVVGVGRRVVGGAAGLVAGGIAGRSLKAALTGAKIGADGKTKGVVQGSVISRTKQAAFAGGAVRQQRADIENDGGSAFRAEHFAGHYKNVAQEQDRRVGTLEAMSSRKKAVSTAVENMKFRQQMETMGQAIEQADASAGKDWVQVKKKAEKLARQYADGKITAIELQQGVNGLINNFNTDMAARGITVRASNIASGSIDSQLQALESRMGQFGNAAVSEWANVRVNASNIESNLAAQLRNGTIDEATYKSQYEAQVNNLIRNFNASMRNQNVDEGVQVQLLANSSSDDFESESAKWGTVHTAMEEAKKVAKAIADSGETYVDRQGNVHNITYNEATFAGDIGDITDSSAAAADQIKASDEYKAAHANAKGADNK